MKSLDSGIIKIDGLSRPQDAITAAECGADLIGFIFAPSRRRVDAKTAGDIIRRVRDSFGDQSPGMVGVFVDPSSDDIDTVYSIAGIDLAQVHSEQIEGIAASSPVPLIRALGPEPGSTADEVIAKIDETSNSVFAVVDGYDPVQRGGRGTRADWELAFEVAARRRILLAGGLDPANVSGAIAKVRPAGVDVSSGVETNGIKDPERIRAFVESARSAFAAVE